VIAVLAVALALASAPADPAAAAAGVPEAQAPLPEAQDAEPDENLVAHGGWRHAVALGPHSTTFFSDEGSQYTFHSGSLGYLGSLGARGAFLHLFLLMPLQARQDGHIYATANYYRRRSGGDLLLGPEWRGTFRRAEAEAGPGLHGTLIYLPGKPGFRDFSALPLGGGIAGSLRWKTRASRFSRAVTVGTYASVAYDFGFTLRAGVLVGLGERR
jgi:hypothetical protein